MNQENTSCTNRQGIKLTSAITALANVLSCQCSTDKLLLLAVILTQLGDTLSTLATKRELLEKFESSAKPP